MPNIRELEVPPVGQETGIRWMVTEVAHRIARNRLGGQEVSPRVLELPLMCLEGTKQAIPATVVMEVLLASAGKEVLLERWSLHFAALCPVEESRGTNPEILETFGRVERVLQGLPTGFYLRNWKDVPTSVRVYVLTIGDEEDPGPGVPFLNTPRETRIDVLSLEDWQFVLSVQYAPTPPFHPPCPPGQSWSVGVQTKKPQQSVEIGSSLSPWQSQRSAGTTLDFTKENTPKGQRTAVSALTAAFRHSVGSVPSAPTPIRPAPVLSIEINPPAPLDSVVSPTLHRSTPPIPVPSSPKTAESDWGIVGDPSLLPLEVSPTGFGTMEQWGRDLTEDSLACRTSSTGSTIAALGLMASPPRPSHSDVLCRPRVPQSQRRRRGSSLRLLGSLEESLLSGNMSAHVPRTEFAGFVADLSVVSTNRTSFPPHHKIPFSAVYYHTGLAIPYVATVELSEEGIPVPASGMFQLTVFNPEKKPIKTFLVHYDLEDMAPCMKTFMRHKTFVRNSTSRVLRYCAHLRFTSSRKGGIFLYKNLLLIFPPCVPDDNEVQEVVVDAPSHPKYFPTM